MNTAKTVDSSLSIISLTGATQMPLMYVIGRFSTGGKLYCEHKSMMILLNDEVKVFF